MEHSLDEYINSKKSNLDKVLLETKGIVDKTALLKDNTSPYLKNLVSGLSSASKEIVKKPTISEKSDLNSESRGGGRDRFDDLFDRDFIAKKKKILQEGGETDPMMNRNIVGDRQNINLEVTNKMVELYIEQKLLDLLENKPELLEKYVIRVLKKYVKTQKK